MAADEAADELVDLEAQPDDHEHVTRGEIRRLTNITVRRLGRIEALCFADTKEQISLSTFITTMNEHRRVMCQWAGWIKDGAKFIGVLGIMCGSLATAAHRIVGIF